MNFAVSDLPDAKATTNNVIDKIKVNITPEAAYKAISLSTFNCETVITKKPTAVVIDANIQAPPTFEIAVFTATLRSPVSP